MTRDFKTRQDHLGLFTLEIKNGGRGPCYIWWDYEEIGDGILLDPEPWGEQGDWVANLAGIDVDTFNDLPEEGEFKDCDAALKYLETKFGPLEEL